MNDYIKYQHVEKLGSTEVDGILFGKCYVFPKIDGTNAHIWIDGGEICAGSRNRKLSIDNDNHGFMEWVLDNQDQLRNILSNLPKQTHLYGEWLVPHTLKEYNADAWRRFYIFDAVSDGNHLHYEDYKQACDNAGYDDYIPPIRIIKNPSEENLFSCLKENKYLLEDKPDVYGEGIVIKNFEYINQYGRQTWAKIVTADFKAKNHKEMGAPECSGSKQIEEEIANAFLTQDMVDKVYANIVSECNGWSSKYIQRFLHTCFYELVRERVWDFIKAHKNPTVNFKNLMRFAVIRAKELKPELF